MLTFEDRPYSQQELKKIRQNYRKKLKIGNKLIYGESNIFFHYNHKYRPTKCILEENNSWIVSNDNLVEKRYKFLVEKGNPYLGVLLYFLVYNLSSSDDRLLTQGFLVTEYTFYSILFS